MAYKQSLTSSFGDRMGWYFVQLSGDINILLNSRNAQPITNTLSGMRSHIAANHPDKVASTETLITAIEGMITALESAMDA